MILAPRGHLQPIDVRDVAALIADTVEQGPAAPPHATILGPEILEIGAMAREWKRATGSRRPIVGLPARGGILRAIAEEQLVGRSPEAAHGQRTWAAWLAERTG